MDLLQLIGVNINNFTQNPIVALLISGAVEGIVIGLIAGALIWSISRAPDAFGRALLLAVIIGVVGFIVEFIRISSIMGVSMGQMIEAMSNNPAIGPMFLAALTRTGFYMLLGALLGVASTVPQHMIRGMIVGIFLGGLVGAALWFLTNYFLGFSFHILLFRFFVVLGIWGLIAAVAD
jgi:hypothetical protein